MFINLSESAKTMIRVRKAKGSDHNEWLRMRKLLWPECPEDRHTLEMDLLTSSRGIVLVAEFSQAAIVGFAEISIRSDHVEGTTKTPVPYLEGWYVDPEYRDKGVGKALVGAAEEFALEKEFTELASDAEIGNNTSIKIHKGLGFREVGRSVHFIKTLSKV
jgi:aminoglycoside 6'-N-acetyltransferase I